MSVTFATAAYVEDPEYGTILDCTVEDWDHPLAVNMANQNARAVLLALGIGAADDDLCGSITPDELRAAVALALADPTVALYGAPTVEVPANPEGRDGWTGRARWIECGRSDDYVPEKLAALDRLAEHAAAHGWMVAWS